MIRITPEIKAEYAARRRAAEQELAARTEAVYALCPRLAELARERRDAIYALGLARLKDPDQAPVHADEYARLNEEQAALLQSLALPADALAMRYTCPLCEDTGYVGKTHKTPCACLKQRLVQEGYASVNLDPAARFSLFREDIYRDPEQRKRTCKLRDACARYAENFPGDGRGLLLYGESGLGKSYLLCCVTHRVLERGYSAVNLTAYKLMREVMDRISRRLPAEDYFTPDLLVVDDLGGEANYGDITVNTIFSVLNERQSARKPTLFATNLSESQLLDAYGERLYSRLVAPRLTDVYRLSGDDLRRQRPI